MYNFWQNRQPMLMHANDGTASCAELLKPHLSAQKV